MNTFCSAAIQNDVAALLQWRKHKPWPLVCLLSELRLHLLIVEDAPFVFKNRRWIYDSAFRLLYGPFDMDRQLFHRYIRLYLLLELPPAYDTNTANAGILSRGTWSSLNDNVGVTDVFVSNTGVFGFSEEVRPLAALDVAADERRSSRGE